MGSREPALGENSFVEAPQAGQLVGLLISHLPPLEAGQQLLPG
jgi:hypothetical protein